MDAPIIIGKLNVVVLVGITKVPNKAGIPITAKVLKMFEPSTLPTAISGFDVFADAHNIRDFNNSINSVFRTCPNTDTTE